MALLEVDNLRVRFATPVGDVPAVDGLSFDVNPNETIAIVGESGSGKSVTAMAIVRLLKTPPAHVSGRILFQGRDLLALPEAEMRHVRGGQIGFVFQEPMSSLNPVMTVGAQIAESVRIHQKVSAREARERTLEMLALVGIPAPVKRINAYPHELSGGMRQRVMIAMALACDPELLIADEPTTALDVTVQAQILDLMRTLKTRRGGAIMLITHDFGVVAEMAERVVILYAGRKVEEASTRSLFANPIHPYTRGLLGAVPRLGASIGLTRRDRLVEIPGIVPRLREGVVGCAFAPRCFAATSVCHSVTPVFQARAPGHLVACHHGQTRSAA